MAHRPEDVAAQERPTAGRTVTVQLADMEPVLGLSAAVARFCASLTPETYATLTPEATEALSTIQGIMWRLEHANPESPRK
jgi:hypothetical protein